MEPIGHLKSLFKFKNGTPRQAGVCSTARGILTISKSIFNNPEHSLEGLEEFSHAWIIFLFHKNNNASVKAKVRPPRLNGKRIGVFATRAPYRPNPIGLTLAKIEKISGAEIHFSGIDLLDGTPVLDVKPFIPQYDDPLGNSMPFQSSNNAENPSSEDPVTSVDQFVKTDQVSPDTKVVTKIDKKVKIDQVSSSSQQENVVDHLPGTDHLQENLDQLNETDQKSPFPKDGLNENQTLQIVQPMFPCHTLNSDPKTTAEHNLPLPTTSTGHLPIPQSNPGSKRTYSTKQAFEDSDIEDTCSVAKLSYQLDTSVSPKSKDSSPSKLPESYVDELYATDEYSLSKDPIHFKKNNSTSVSVQINKNSEIGGNPVTQNLVSQANGSPVTTTASWVTQAPVSKLNVIFTARAKQQLLNFSLDSDNPAFRLQFLQNKNEVYQAISDILAEDPRSVYRRNACKDSLYYFAVDSVHVTCWFFDNFAEILFIQPASHVPQTRDS